jgi:hypothetical protein
LYKIVDKRKDSILKTIDINIVIIYKPPQIIAFEILGENDKSIIGARDIAATFITLTLYPSIGINCMQRITKKKAATLRLNKILFIISNEKVFQPIEYSDFNQGYEHKWF